MYRVRRICLKKITIFFIIHFSLGKSNVSLHRFLTHILREKKIHIYIRGKWKQIRRFINMKKKNTIY